MKDIPGYEGLYAATLDGKIWSHRNKKILKPKLYKNGYLAVNLYKDKKVKMLLVHRMIFLTFNGDISGDLSVDHIDGDKQNNAITNLQLLSNADNLRKAIAGKPSWKRGKTGFKTWNKGIPQSDEVKNKISESIKLMWKKKKGLI